MHCHRESREVAGQEESLEICDSIPENKITKMEDND